MSGHALPTVVVRRARPDDLAAVQRLLTDAALPIDGVEQHFGGFLVAIAASGVVGAIGVESYGPFGLLRSAVVERDSQGRGIGALLTLRVLNDARARGLSAVYLLTTTAADYFVQFGFRRIARGDVAQELWQSAELQGACPETATVLMLNLSASPAGVES